MIEIPKFYETFIPILDCLGSSEIINRTDLKKRVFEKCYSKLSKDQLSETTKDGSSLVLNRIGWGIAYLKQAKFIHQPSRAMIQITDKGQSVLKSGVLSLKDLKNDIDFRSYESGKKTSSVVEINAGESTPQDLIDAGIIEIEKQAKLDLLDRLKTVDPYYFEHIVLDLFGKMGYGKLQSTSKSGDGGIDGVINQDELGLDKIYVQAKRYSENKVHETDIRNFIGAMSGDVSKGIFVTTSSFDNKAIQKAHDAIHKIILIDGERLSELAYEYGVGVQVKNVYEVKEIDEDYFN